MRALLTRLALASLAFSGAPAPEAQPAAHQILARALDAMGGPSEIVAGGGLLVHAEGSRNLAAEHQGRSPGGPDKVPYREAFALDPIADRFAREYRYDRPDGSIEWLRDIYEGAEDRKILVLQDGFAVWLRSPDHAEERRRYTRRVPQLLLAEALSRKESLRRLGERNGRHAVAATVAGGTTVTLLFDRETMLLARVEYLADVQSLGDAEMAWSFADWRPLGEGLRFPHRIEASVAGRPFLELDVTRAQTGRAGMEAIFSAPAGMSVPDTPQTLPKAADPSALARVRQEAPGVYTVRNLRSGFHPMFIELGECVLAIDAPAGYRLLEQLPAGDVAAGPNSAWLSERYLELIHETLPGRRVCWVVLTHFHGDHVGGLRAFVAEGATLLVSPGDREAVQALLDNPHRVAPDRLAESPLAARIEPVEKPRRLTGGGRSVEILPAGANPHTDEMLLVHLPDERWLFVSDLLTPAPLEDFPTASHAALDRRFVEWLDGARLDPERVYAMHGSGVASRAHLEKLRGSSGAPRLVTIVPDHPLDVGAGTLPHVEPHLAAHPEDPRHLVAASIVVAPEPEGPWRCAAFVSRDAGRSWGRHDLAIDRCIDPWVLLTAEGHALATAIEIERDRPGDERFRLLLFRSQDGGHSWTNRGIELGRGHDHQLLLREPSGGVVMASRRAFRTPQGAPRHAVSVMRSEDGGASFQTAAEVLPGNLALNATGLVRLKDGALVVSLLDFQRNVDGFESRGGLRQPRAWVLRSGDGGRSFSEPLFASEGCGSSDSFAGYPALAVDASNGTFRDRLYHACVGAGFDGLVLTTSSDGGETWSEPLRIDRLDPGRPGHVRTPMLAVNRDGVIAAAWYDRTGDHERRCQDLLMTASADGGASFLAPMRVSTETSCPQTPGNGRAARSWPMGGDYGSLASAADGSFHVVWADSRSGVFQLRHAALRLEPRGDAARAGEGQ